MDDPRRELETQVLALVIWREARGEGDDGKVAVGCSVRNRVGAPRWWGYDYLSVILNKWQFSSFNADDPNAHRWPAADDPSWAASLAAAGRVLGGCPDTTDGADSYFDSSLDGHPPQWTQPATSHHTATIGRLRFWRTR